jgi:hypothetical protein
MSFLQYFNTSYWLIPSYAPAYGQLGNYEIWGQSILMYFFLFCTAVTLAIVTLMDSDSPNIPSPSSSSGSMMNIPSELGPGIGQDSELGPPVAAPIGGKKWKHKNKSKRRK